MSNKVDPGVCRKLAEMIRDAIGLGGEVIRMSHQQGSEIACQLEAAAEMAERYVDDLEIFRAMESDLAHNRRREDTAEIDLVDLRKQILYLKIKISEMQQVVEAAERYRDNGACYAGIIPAVDAYRKSH